MDPATAGFLFSLAAAGIKAAQPPPLAQRRAASLARAFANTGPGFLPQDIINQLQTERDILEGGTGATGKRSWVPWAVGAVVALGAVGAAALVWKRRR